MPDADTPGWMSDDRVERWHRRLFHLALLNLAVFFACALFVVHGDAVNGDATCSGAHYVWDHAGSRFLWTRGAPNPCREVSRGVYLYSKAHVYSLFVTFPPAILGGWYVKMRKRSRQRKG